MAVRIPVKRNYGGKLLVSIKRHNLHSFKEGMILLCHSILETRRILNLHGSALFTILLKICYGRACFYIVRIKLSNKGFPLLLTTTQ